MTDVQLLSVVLAVTAIALAFLAILISNTLIKTSYGKIQKVESVDQKNSSCPDGKGRFQGEKVCNSCTRRVPDVRKFSQHGEVNGDCDLSYLWRIYQQLPLHARIAMKSALSGGLKRKYPDGLHQGFFHYLQNFTVYVKESV